MALANNLGLTEKVVSERHYLASQTKMTAGDAAKLITKETKTKVLVKDLKILYELQFGCDMEWHHSGFYAGACGRTMGRTYFISPEDTQVIIDNFSTLYAYLEQNRVAAEKNVYAIFWEWVNRGSKRRPRWAKRLGVYAGKRAKLPKNSTECNKHIYEAAKKEVGRIYTGYNEPMTSDFIDNVSNKKR